MLLEFRCFRSELRTTPVYPLSYVNKLSFHLLISSLKLFLPLCINMSTNDPTKTMWNQQQELYLKYKSKTERVLSWLKTTTNMKPGAPISSKYQYNINDFIDSAKALRRNGLKAPEYIYWDLEDAIKGRNEVSIFYHTQVIKTTQQKITTHVFFTDGLKTIRDSLFPNPPKTTRPAPKAPDRHLRSSGVENMFTTLSIEDPSETDIGEVSSPKAVSQIMGTPSKVTKEEAPHDITVEGDDMDKFYELAEWMSKVEYLIEEGIEVWKRARLGANSVPLALLGWLSYVLDAAIAASITELIALLAQPYSSIDPQHHETINKFPVGHDLHGQTGNHSGIVKAVFDFKNEYLGKNGMVDPIVLSDKTGSAMSINLVPLDVEILWRDWTFPKPFDYMEDSPSDYESNREKLYFGKISPFVECMLAGLQRFKQDRPFPQYLGKDWHINALCFNIGSRPLLSIASDASTLDPIDFRRSMMALSMTMLLQLKAYQVFYHCVSFDGSRNGMSPPSNTCDSRFKSFVKEFAVSLETVYTHNMIKECENLPDECFAMMKNSHKQILDEANAYPLATAWYFDLYAMAPMTAAVQIMALRQLSIKMAGDLCDEKGMFGAVLHLYNAMVSSGRMPQMQLLEFVCDVLFDQVFMGKRDTTNKTSSFRRFLGADQYDDAAKDTRHVSLPSHDSLNDLLSQVCTNHQITIWDRSRAHAWLSGLARSCQCDDVAFAESALLISVSSPSSPPLPTVSERYKH